MVDAVGKDFGFEVVVTARTVVRAGDGGEARAALERALDCTTAIVRTGPGTRLELAALGLVASPRLTTIDGEDPVAVLAEALRRFREPGGGGP